MLHPKSARVSFALAAMQHPPPNSTNHKNPLSRPNVTLDRPLAHNNSSTVHNDKGISSSPSSSPILSSCYAQITAHSNIYISPSFQLVLDEMLQPSDVEENIDESGSESDALGEGYHTPVLHSLRAYGRLAGASMAMATASNYSESAFSAHDSGTSISSPASASPFGMRLAQRTSLRTTSTSVMGRRSLSPHTATSVPHRHFATAHPASTATPDTEAVHASSPSSSFQTAAAAGPLLVHDFSGHFLAHVGLAHLLLPARADAAVGADVAAGVADDVTATDSPTASTTASSSSSSSSPSSVLFTLPLTHLAHLAPPSHSLAPALPVTQDTLAVLRAACYNDISLYHRIKRKDPLTDAILSLILERLEKKPSGARDASPTSSSSSSSSSSSLLPPSSSHSAPAKLVTASPSAVLSLISSAWIAHANTTNKRYPEFLPKDSEVSMLFRSIGDAHERQVLRKMRQEVVRVLHARGVHFTPVNGNPEESLHASENPENAHVPENPSQLRDSEGSLLFADLTLPYQYAYDQVQLVFGDATAGANQDAQAELPERDGETAKPAPETRPFGKPVDEQFRTGFSETLSSMLRGDWVVYQAPVLCEARTMLQRGYRDVLRAWQWREAEVVRERQANEQNREGVATGDGGSNAEGNGYIDGPAAGVSSAPSVQLFGRFMPACIDVARHACTCNTCPHCRADDNNAGDVAAAADATVDLGAAYTRALLYDGDLLPLYPRVSVPIDGAYDASDAALVSEEEAPVRARVRRKQKPNSDAGHADGSLAEKDESEADNGQSPSPERRSFRLDPILGMVGDNPTVLSGLFQHISPFYGAKSLTGNISNFLAAHVKSTVADAVKVRVLTKHAHAALRRRERRARNIAAGGQSAVAGSEAESEGAEADSLGDSEDGEDSAAATASGADVSSTLGSATSTATAASSTNTAASSERAPDCAPTAHATTTASSSALPPCPTDLYISPLASDPSHLLMRGSADFLVRRPRQRASTATATGVEGAGAQAVDSEHGYGTDADAEVVEYELWDAKLARTASPSALLQTLMYADALNTALEEQHSTQQQQYRARKTEWERTHTTPFPEKRPRKVFISQCGLILGNMRAITFPVCLMARQLVWQALGLYARSVETYHPLSPPSLPRTVTAAGDYSARVQDIWRRSGSLCILNGIRESTLAYYAKAGIFDLRMIVLRTMRSQLCKHIVYLPTVAGHSLSLTTPESPQILTHRAAQHAHAQRGPGAVVMDGYAALTLHQLAQLADAAQVELAVLEHKAALMEAAASNSAGQQPQGVVDDAHSLAKDARRAVSGAVDADVDACDLAGDGNVFQGSRAHADQPWRDANADDASRSPPNPFQRDAAARANSGVVAVDVPDSLDSVGFDIELGQPLSVPELLARDSADAHPHPASPSPSPSLSSAAAPQLLPTEPVAALHVDPDTLLSPELAPETVVPRLPVLSAVDNAQEFRAQLGIPDNLWELPPPAFFPASSVDPEEDLDGPGPTRSAKQACLVYYVTLLADISARTARLLAAPHGAALLHRWYGHTALPLASLAASAAPATTAVSAEVLDDPCPTTLAMYVAPRPFTHAGVIDGSTPATHTPRASAYSGMSPLQLCLHLQGSAPALAAHNTSVLDTLPPPSDRAATHLHMTTHADNPASPSTTASASASAAASTSASSAPAPLVAPSSLLHALAAPSLRTGTHLHAATPPSAACAHDVSALPHADCLDGGDVFLDLEGSASHRAVLEVDPAVEPDSAILQQVAHAADADVKAGPEDDEGSEADAASAEADRRRGLMLDNDKLEYLFGVVYRERALPWAHAYAHSSPSPAARADLDSIVVHPAADGGFTVHIQEPFAYARTRSSVRPAWRLALHFDAQGTYRSQSLLSGGTVGVVGDARFLPSLATLSAAVLDGMRTAHPTLPPAAIRVLFAVAQGHVLCFREWWAHSTLQEQIAFEACVDWLVQHKRRFPHMHVYHYSTYEASAFRRLASKYRTRMPEVATMVGSSTAKSRKPLQRPNNRGKAASKTAAAADFATDADIETDAPALPPSSKPWFFDIYPVVNKLCDLSARGHSLKKIEQVIVEVDVQRRLAYSHLHHPHTTIATPASGTAATPSGGVGVVEGTVLVAPPLHGKEPVARMYEESALSPLADIQQTNEYLSDVIARVTGAPSPADSQAASTLDVNTAASSPPSSSTGSTLPPFLSNPMLESRSGMSAALDSMVAYAQWLYRNRRWVHACEEQARHLRGGDAEVVDMVRSTGVEHDSVTSPAQGTTKSTPGEAMESARESFSALVCGAPPGTDLDALMAIREYNKRDCSNLLLVTQLLWDLQGQLQQGRSMMEVANYWSNGAQAGAHNGHEQTRKAESPVPASDAAAATGKPKGRKSVSKTATTVQDAEGSIPAVNAADAAAVVKPKRARSKKSATSPTD